MTFSPLQRPSSKPGGHHAPAEVYRAFLEQHCPRAPRRTELWRWRTRFVQAYPTLQEWFDAPLPERVGLLYGEDRSHASYPVSYWGRRYLYFLGLQGYAQFDWEWLIALQHVYIWEQLQMLGLADGLNALLKRALTLGYQRKSITDALRLVMSRVFLHLGQPSVKVIREAHFAGLAEALHRFEARPDLTYFFGTVEHYQSLCADYRTCLYTLQVVLYHEGLINTPPRRKKRYAGVRLPDVTKPRLAAVVARYLTTRGLTDAPTTVRATDVDLRRFTDWLAETYPKVDSFANVTRDQVLEFAEALKTMKGVKGHVLAAQTRRSTISQLRAFFHDVATWGWKDVPQRPLLGRGDLPKQIQALPRYLPAEELAEIMDQIRALSCPYQRAALLIARWSGARRDEIRRLSLDCLDAYADGTPRLHIPVGKGKRERIVPLNEEAAQAIRTLQAASRGERGLPDPETGLPTRYLFVQRGQLLSEYYLFHTSLKAICTTLGLLTADGKKTVHPHRFRHTVGHQLAEKGAKLQTIMKILGHESAMMSMIYAQISDPVVRAEYEAVLGKDAALAGPFAHTLQAGELSAADLDWLKVNYFKTELELGRCFRLPQEGPCECDLYLSCAKFVTTPAYAPRLRHRRQIELQLIADAEMRGWAREVERHRSIVRRLETLLTDLGEPLDGPVSAD